MADTSDEGPMQAFALQQVPFVLFRVEEHRKLDTKNG